MNKLTVEDLDVKGKKVLLRVDFNVPLDKNQQVADNSRILAALPTIKYLLKNGARLILISHLGRPMGKVTDTLSLRPVAEVLETVLKKKIVFSPPVLGTIAQTAIDCSDFKPLVLENDEALVIETILGRKKDAV